MCKTSELAHVIEELLNAATALFLVTDNLLSLFANQAGQSNSPAPVIQKTTRPLTLKIISAI